MAKRKCSKAEKLAIIKEAEAQGVQVTLRKHGVYPASYYTWKKKYEQNGEAGLDTAARQRKDQQYIRQLEDERSLVKQLLADKEMELALKDELLKKSIPGREKSARASVHGTGNEAEQSTGDLCPDERSTVLQA